MSRRFLTYEEAISLLPDGESIHTFYNPGFGLIGADWCRKDILEKLQKSEIIELTGEMARRMGHGICAYNKNTKRQDEILFIETDVGRLEEFDSQPKGGETNGNQ